MRTQVGIIGAGPSGLLLSQLLHLAGIDTIVLERRSPEYVLGRIRAGVLEPGTVDLLRQAGAGARMDREGIPHSGVELCFNGHSHRIDLEQLTGKQVMIYGQTEITKDLMEARTALGGHMIYEAEDVSLHNLEGARPEIHYQKAGKTHKIICDYIAGCDGFHGVSRQYMDSSEDYEQAFPFAWLGLLSETKPVTAEICYVKHERGFALCSLRSHTRSRYYLQCALDEKVENWSDDRFWGELTKRLPADIAANLETGPSLEKSIAPLRSFVAGTLQYGRLFLAGDAAHIAPPTGAKGLNLAASDVGFLSAALIAKFKQDNDEGLITYSDDCLNRVWKAQKFSRWLTTLMHQSEGKDELSDEQQLSELRALISSPEAQKTLAQSYVGVL